MAKVLYGIEELRGALPKGTALVATVGFFDGMHRGHQALIQRTHQVALARSASSLIITLAEHPATVLAPASASPRLLTPTSYRIELLSATEATYLLVLPFSKQVAAQTVAEFLAPLIELGLTHLVLGYDNRFGKKVEGEPLAAFDERIQQLGITLERVPSLTEGELVISSTAIRTALSEHRLPLVEQLLGRPYALKGQVAEGRQIGRTIGYPTANLLLSPQLLPPPVGVYVAEVRWNGNLYPAMAYYGSSPTVTGGSAQEWLRLEVFLLGYQGSLYGEQLEVALRLYLRGDHHFPTLQALQEQLKRDEEATLHFFNQHPSLWIK